MKSILLSRIGTNGLTKDSYTASSTYPYDHPSGAFDGYYPYGGTGEGSSDTNIQNRGQWMSEQGKLTNQWIQVRFNEPVMVNKIRFHHHYNEDILRNPKDCILQGSNDNITFIDIQAITFKGITGWQEVNINNENKYKIYRLFVKNNCGSSYCIGIGELELCMEIDTKFLIKQNNRYYTIQSEHYQDGQFQPLTLEGGLNPNVSDYEKFCFYNINKLCTNMTVGEETFRPIDKLNDEFEVKMMKE